MKPDIEAIRKRAEACFRAPWTFDSFTVRCENVDHADSGFEDCDGEHDVERIESPNEYPDGQVIADVPGLEQFSKAHAAFIAHAREDIPALCSRVEELEKALARIVEYADDHFDSCEVFNIINGPHACDCGYEQARAALRGGTPEGGGK